MRSRSSRHMMMLTLALVCAQGWQVLAQSETGAISGRVSSETGGQYLERVHITVVGTALETFTDADGKYFLSKVPAGTVKLRAFYTGRIPEIDSITVHAGETTHHPFELVSSLTGSNIGNEERSRAP
jgi:Fe-S cluster assembly scaffold protein SufB